jgi:hypothetical protein
MELKHGQVVNREISIKANERREMMTKEGGRRRSR